MTEGASENVCEGRRMRWRESECGVEGAPADPSSTSQVSAPLFIPKIADKLTQSLVIVTNQQFHE